MRLIPAPLPGEGRADGTSAQLTLNVHANKDRQPDLVTATPHSVMNRLPSHCSPSHPEFRDLPQDLTVIITSASSASAPILFSAGVAIFSPT